MTEVGRSYGEFYRWIKGKPRANQIINEIFYPIPYALLEMNDKMKEIWDNHAYNADKREG